MDANGFCAWAQDGNDDMNWIRSQGPTPSSYTGPVGDHTSGAGVEIRYLLESYRWVFSTLSTRAY